MVKTLVKPVGLERAPTAAVKYHEGNSFREMFDNAKTSKRTEELELEFSKSGFYDVYTFRKTKGKLFLSPASYWRKDKALYFPHLHGRSLSDSSTQNVEDCMRGKISVVRMFTSEVGDELVKSYFRQGEEDYLRDEAKLNTAGDPVHTQIVEVNLVENFMKSLIVKMSLGKIRKSVPEARHSRYFVCERDQLPFLVREELQMNNLYTGYVVVVDPDLRIRWMGCGGADQREFNLLWKCVRGLQREQTQ